MALVGGVSTPHHPGVQRLEPDPPIDPAVAALLPGLKAHFGMGT